MSPNLTAVGQAFSRSRRAKMPIQKTEKPLVKSRSVKQAEALFNSRIFLPEELLKSY